jgi:hypothetical protein
MTAGAATKVSRSLLSCFVLLPLNEQRCPVTWSCDHEVSDSTSATAAAAAGGDTKGGNQSPEPPIKTGITVKKKL